MDALQSDSSNMFAEDGYDCDDSSNILDLGLMKLSTGAAAMDSIQKTVQKELNRGQKVISIGGDHSVTFPIIQAYHEQYSNLNILHIDAHPDLYDNFEGNPFSHASPFARIMEKGLVKRLVQVGIRTLNNHQKEQVKRFGFIWLLGASNRKKSGPGSKTKNEVEPSHLSELTDSHEMETSSELSLAPVDS